MVITQGALTQQCVDMLRLLSKKLSVNLIYKICTA